MTVPPLAGRYVLRREVGAGASARVYLAEDQKFGRTVAVKMLNAAFAHSAEVVQRLEREARVSALINHANVCAVSDVGRLDNGLPFLVMEYLEGETLAARLEREKRLPVPVAVQFAEEMLLGLSAAHRRGIVHRDVKPANVFIVDLGHGRHIVKLLDFGTAYLTAAAGDAPPSLTRAGRVVGTPEFMSPEQVRGLRDFDARTDIYACGVVAYQMLAGRRPFDGLPTEQLSHAIAFNRAPSLSAVAPFVPPPIALAVDLALALDLTRRHKDAGAFLAALGQESVAEAPPTMGIHAITFDDAPAPPTIAGADWDASGPQAGTPSTQATSPMARPLTRRRG